jgi:hypothetical protein
MQALNLPPFEYNLKSEASKTYIFDIIRKKYFLNTPEEWVRQHFVHFLINHRNYSKNLFKLETGINYGNRRKRTDIQIFSNDGLLTTIIECKAPEIKLNQKVINQILQYQKVLTAKLLVITNGLEHIIISVLPDGKIEYLTDIPYYI